MFAAALPVAILRVVVIGVCPSAEFAHSLQLQLASAYRRAMIELHLVICIAVSTAFVTFTHA